MNYKIVLILILAFLAVLFIIQNVALVEVQFLFWSIQMSRSLLMFLLVAIGVFLCLEDFPFTYHSMDFKQRYLIPLSPGRLKFARAQTAY